MHDLAISVLPPAEVASHGLLTWLRTLPTMLMDAEPQNGAGTSVTQIDGDAEEGQAI